MTHSLETSQIAKPFTPTLNMMLYGTTDQRYNINNQKPVWVTPSTYIVNDYVYTLSCEDHDIGVDVYKWKGGKVAMLKDYTQYIVEVWPEYTNADFENDVSVFPFFNVNYGEHKASDVQKFIKLLVDAGFDAAIHDDYACDDTTYLLCVFDASKSLELTNIKFDIIEYEE